MPVELPDVNVLLAMADPKHVQHARASEWFEVASVDGWATCPITECGFVRIISNPRYSSPLTVPGAVEEPHAMIESHSGSHTFWPDAVSLTDESLFDLSSVQGHQQITDIYLLGLCQRHGGRLATFDERITTSAIVSPSPDLLKRL